jgi:dihydrolipoamide dehydrogenase
MDRPFDLIVIGAGPGGYVAARRAAQLGLKTALVEKDDRLGGTCLLRGCIPTKALIHAAEVWHTCSKKARTFGVNVDGAGFDWEKILKRKEMASTKGAKGVELLMQNSGVTVIHGRGRLQGMGRVAVDSPGGETVLTGDRIILATGSTCAGLPGLEPDGEAILTSDHLLERRQVPDSMIVLGAGAVGLELATVMQTFGCRTTLVEFMDQVLPLEDPECAAEVQNALKRLKMQVLTGWKAKGAALVAAGVAVKLQNAADKDHYQTLQAECLLVAVGRQPATRDLGLETVEVVTDRRGFIQTDAMMQTATPGLYAIGDIVPTPQLAHLASHEALVAAGHAAGQPLPPINLGAVPSCTYSNPEVASVGLREDAALAAGHQVRAGRFPFSALGKASILGEPQGFIKVVADAETDRVLGVHMVGPRVTELIGEACAAVTRGTTLEDWAETIHPHPTLSEALGEAVLAAAGRPLHGG